jgi:hypothetical protein
LSIDTKKSSSTPFISPLSDTPIRRVPPSAFKNPTMFFREDFSISLSF